MSFTLMVFSYWLFLTGAIFVAGAFTSRIFVTGPSGADLCIPGDKGKCLGEIASQFILWASLVTFVVSAVHAVFHASVMTETPLNEVFSVIMPFLTKTKYGKFTLLRTTFVGMLIVLSYFCVRRKTRVADMAGAFISLGLLATISMSGHQGAEGYLNTLFVMDALHILTVSLWMGGVFFIFMCYSFLIKDAGEALLANLRSMINRFSNMATICVAIAVITGAVMSFLTVKSVELLIETPYGIALVAKIVLVGVILTMGAANKFYIVPKINSAGTSDGEDLSHIKRRLSAFIAVEAYVGAGVLLATAVLTHLSPEG